MKAQPRQVEDECEGLAQAVSSTDNNTSCQLSGSHSSSVVAFGDLRPINLEWILPDRQEVSSAQRLDLRRNNCHERRGIDRSVFCEGER